MYPSLLSMLVSSVGMFIFGFGGITGCSFLVWDFLPLLGPFNVSAYHTIIKYNELCQCFIINNSRMSLSLKCLFVILIELGCHIEFSS